MNENDKARNAAAWKFRHLPTRSSPESPVTPDSSAQKQPCPVCKGERIINGQGGSKQCPSCSAYGTSAAETPSPSAQTQEYPAGGITGLAGDTRSLYEQILWELENAAGILKNDGYNFSHGRIQNLLTKAKAVREEKEQTQDLLEQAMQHPGVAVYEEVFGKPEPSADHAQAVLQMALTVGAEWKKVALMLRDWVMTPTIGELSKRTDERTDELNPIIIRIDNLLSSHSNAAGAPPISPSPSSLPPQSQGSEQNGEVGKKEADVNADNATKAATKPI